MTLAIVVGVGTVALWALLAVLAIGYRPPRPISPWSFWFAIAGLFWSMGEVGTSLPTVTEDQLWKFLVLQYTGIVFIGPLWWAVVVSLATRLGTRPAWLTERAHYGPLLLSLVAFAALITNPWHGRFLVPVLEGRNVYRAFWYYQATYGYLVMFAAQAIVVWSWAKLPRGSRYRAQLGVLFVVTFLPHVANFLYISRLVDTGVDPTVGAFGVAIIVALTGVPRRGLFGMSGLTLEHWLDHETDGVAIVDSNHRLVRTNPAALSLLEVSELPLETDVLAFLGERLCPPDEDAPMGRERLSEALAGEEAEAGELFRLSTNPKRWIRLRATRIPARWPSRAGMALGFRDESRLEVTSERASRQAASIDVILGSIQDGLFVADEAGRLVYANERFWELWELPAVLSASTTESELVDLLRGRLESEMSGGLLTWEGGRHTGETDLRLRSGRVLSYAVAPLERGERGKGGAGRVWTFRDQTERRRAEEDRLLAEERRGTSHKLESLGMLASAIAHDFNNILVGIMGSIDLAASVLEGTEPQPRAAEEHLSRARRSTDRAAELVQQLLSYAGRGKVQRDTVNLSTLVQDTLELIRTIISKKATLRVELDPDALMIGDAVQLRQIVMNLLTNASEALEDKAGIVEIRTSVGEVPPERLLEALPQRSEHPEGRYVELRVSDSGCGMSAEKRARIFEPFYSTKVRGRGLGLAAVLGIVRQHGGFIQVRSEPLVGSTFVLWFPLVEKQASLPSEVAAPSRVEEEVEEVEEEAAEAPLERSPGSGTVLVVDDELAVREVAEQALVLDGFEVLAASDGHEAVALFREHVAEIDVVLLDLTMPRMDGAETLFAIRQSSRTVPIILSSGYSEAQSMRRTSGLSFVSFIQKPYTANALVAKIREAVRESSQAETIADR